MRNAANLECYNEAVQRLSFHELCNVDCSIILWSVCLHKRWSQQINFQKKKKRKKKK